ncbi:MAG: hypothetical protein GYB31_10465 [Bacteroidetes bacterium]|nr:hypothetical protein [Bacteroidota bacterium]
MRENKKHRLLYLLKLFSFNLLLLLLLAECGLRCIGYAGLYKYTVHSDPPNCIQADPQLGFQLVPGEFEVRILEKHHYQTSQLRHSVINHRKTSSNPQKLQSDSFLLITGCSFASGMGVDNDQTFPWLLQEKDSNTVVFNAAVPAFGTIQALLITERFIEQGLRPKQLVYAYLDFHKERNILSRTFCQKIFRESDIQQDSDSSFTFPYAQIENGKLQIKHRIPYSNNYFGSVRNYSATFNLLENQLNKLEDREAEANAVTRALILRLRDQCKEAGIQFGIYILKEDKDNGFMRTLCQKENIPFLITMADYSQEGATNQPYDGHPSPQTHRLFAEELYDWISKKEMQREER